jgi:hypothetical protein
VKQLAATSLLCPLSLFFSQGTAEACAVPLQPYDARAAVAAITATVTSVRGSGDMATYRVQRIAIAKPAPGSLLLPTKLELKMIKYSACTCGSQSPMLRTGNRIVLYFEISDGKLTPRAWVVF